MRGLGEESARLTSSRRFTEGVHCPSRLPALEMEMNDRHSARQNSTHTHQSDKTKDAHSLHSPQDQITLPSISVDNPHHPLGIRGHQTVRLYWRPWMTRPVFDLLPIKRAMPRPDCGGLAVDRHWPCPGVVQP